MSWKMPVEVFLENCAKFVFYSAKFIGLVTTTTAASTYPPKKSHGKSSISAIDAAAVGNKWRDSAARCNHRNRNSSSNNNCDPFPDADATTTPNNNCQLSCDGARCNRNIRSRVASCLNCTPFFLPLLLLVYPVVVFFVKSCAADNQRTTSYFNLFVFITLYVHYVLMVVVCTMVVLRNRSAFTDALSRLNSLIQSICDSMSTTFADGNSPGNDYQQRKELWIRSRSIDLGLKCGLGIILAVLCWLNINLPILSATNWITILCSSLILILPTLLLVALSATFYALAVVMESLLFVLNSWLRDTCMQLVGGQQDHAAEERSPRIKAHQQEQGFGRNKLWQLSICDNVDIIIQYYSRTLQLLKQLNHFHAMPALLIILNCFFNVAVQSFSIYMALSAPDVTADGGASLDDDGYKNITTSDSLYFIRDINSNNSSNNNCSIRPLEVAGSPKESPQTGVHLYIIAVNAVYILINYCELFATIRASVAHRTAVSI